MVLKRIWRNNKSRKDYKISKIWMNIKHSRNKRMLTTKRSIKISLINNSKKSKISSWMNREWQEMKRDSIDLISKLIKCTTTVYTQCFLVGHLKSVNCLLDRIVKWSRNRSWIKLESKIMALKEMFQPINLPIMVVLLLYSVVKTVLLLRLHRIV